MEQSGTVHHRTEVYYMKIMADIKHRLPNAKRRKRSWCVDGFSCLPLEVSHDVDVLQRIDSPPRLAEPLMSHDVTDPIPKQRGDGAWPT